MFLDNIIGDCLITISDKCNQNRCKSKNIFFTTSAYCGVGQPVSVSYCLGILMSPIMTIFLRVESTYYETEAVIGKHKH